MRNKYSDIKTKLPLEIKKTDNDDLAHFTHFLQNPQNKISKYYKPIAKSYLTGAHEKLNIVEEPDFQAYLPINWDVPFPPPTAQKFKFIDLFAGIGGIRMAFQNIGGKCVFTSEWDTYSKKTYDANFGEVPFGDITKISENDIPDHDILLGGFPCQPFSLAGVSKKNSLGRAHGFLDETQGTLFFDVARIIKHKMPKAFMLENVKNLVSHDKGKTFTIIKETLKEPTITSKNLNPMINVIAETSNDSQIYPLLNARDEMLKNLSNDYEIIKTDMLNLSFIDKNTKERFDLVFDGELKVTIDTFIDLGGAFIIALVLIFFLMVMYYKSFALSGGIVLSSFISIIGVIFAHIIMDLITADTFYLTATSLIGFIGLIGINSRNSTLIIDFSKQLVHEKNLSINEAIAKATATRSKPIILTVLTMVFASALIANDAVFGGLGVALIGGTLISYVVSMFFVPVIIKNQLKKIL